MIRNLGKVFLALCFLTVGGGAVANAQIDRDSRIEANVPFAFVVVNTTLPAGKYEIKWIDGNSPTVLEIRSYNGRRAVIFDTDVKRTPNDEPANKTELIFNKIGDKYFLSQIWADGDVNGNQLEKSKTEKSLEGDGTQTERHSIAAIRKR